MYTLLTPPPITDATRREFLALLGAAGLLTGCATTDSDPVPPQRRTFTDDLGRDVEIPARPQRIVCAWGYGGASVLEAEGALIGMPLSTEPRLTEALRATHGLDGVADIVVDDGAGVEAVVALQPDLIVFASGDGVEPDLTDAYARLADVAPCVVLNNFQSVDTLSARTAELVGTGTDAVAALRAEFDTSLDDLRAVLDAPGLSIAFALYGGPDVLFTYGPDRLPAMDVLTRAGASWLPVAAEADAAGGDLPLSLERIGDLSADLIVVYHLGDADLTAEPVFAALPAARAGQVVPLPETHQAITWRNYTALARTLTDLITDLGPLDADLA